jgi:hypothetical protein
MNSLIQGNEIKCPRDKRFHPGYDYSFLQSVDRYRSFLNIVIICRTCKHIFSPKMTQYQFEQVWPEGNYLDAN